MSNSFEAILRKNRFLEVCYENLGKHIKESHIHKIFLLHFESYIIDHKIELDYIIDTYLRFLRKYQNDCKEFAKNNKSEYLSNGQHISYSRLDYDLILILSTLLTEHRFSIMKNILCNDSKDTLLVGVGPGIELTLIKTSKEIDAFDIGISKWLINKFPEVKFYSQVFMNQNKKKYDTIFLIEILEHLDDPYKLLKLCSDSLFENGEIKLTTATNIPQFDHKYNFEFSHKEFEEKIYLLGLQVKEKRIIKHKTLHQSFNSYNHFYTLRKF